jgi:hypothetical protein
MSATPFSVFKITMSNTLFLIEMASVERNQKAQKVFNGFFDRIRTVNPFCFAFPHLFESKIDPV